MEYYYKYIIDGDLLFEVQIKTGTRELTAIVFKNGVPAVKGKCAECGT